MGETDSNYTEPTNLRMVDPGVRRLFTIESRWQAWLDVEAALARAEAGLGMIPAAAAEEIAAKARVELLDRERILEGLRRTAHQLVPLVWELARVCEGDAGRYVHWGATTQNITQTGELLLVRGAHRIFLGQLAGIFAALAELATLTRDYAMPGRTHGQHAVPITFGLKVGGWIDELARHLERLRGAEPRVFVAMLGGAAGSLASFGAHGFAVQAAMAEHLAMRPMAVPSRTILDHLGEYTTLLGLLAATCGKIGQEIYLGMKDEFGEVEEPWEPGTVGSSTMPQKRNPKFAQDIMVGAARIRALVPVALEAMQVEHEANRANSVLMSSALEPACELMGDLLQRIRVVAEGLTVKPERMRRNLDLSDGLILSEALMLRLGEHIGRQAAHDVVYEAAQAAAQLPASGSGSPAGSAGRFRALLQADQRIAVHLDSAALDALLDPSAYTGLCAEIADQQAERARRLAAELHGGAGD